MNRAYAVLHVKSFDTERRTITGIASTPSPDRDGDVMEPLGAKFASSLPLLYQHDAKQPVGHVKFNRPTADGITFEAQIPVIDEPGQLKDRLDLVWQSVKAGLVRGVSIGFRGVDGFVERMKSGGLHFKQFEVFELSLVTIPANSQALIHTIKHFDTGLAATGTQSDLERHPAGATAPTRVVTARSDRPMKTSIAEQITTFESTRVLKHARADEIMTKAAELGVTLDEGQKEEYDGLLADVKEIDEHLVRLADLETRMKAMAKPVAGDDPEKASRARGGSVITVQRTLPPGIEFARYAMCLASAKGNVHQAVDIAKARYPDEPRIQLVLKAAVAAGTTTDASWAGNLVQYQDFAGDFIDFLRPQTIIGKFGQNGIPSLRRVPFNIRIARQTTGGEAYWVGQGKPKPLTKFAFDTVTMTWAKVANIAVLTEEEVRFSSPSAEAKVRDGLAAALIQRLDIDFIDPAKAAVANVSPASITNGVAATPPTGTTAAFFRADVRSLMAPYFSADMSLSSLVWIMSSTQALALSLIQNSLGQSEYPGLTMNGGTLFGIPVITSEHLTAVGSPSTQMIVLVSASDIYLADDGQVVIDASREASLEMLDGSLVQDATAGTGASLVSMWQSNCLALKAERFINWSKRRADAVHYISPAAYVG